MTIRTTLSFTDRHHDWLSRKVADGVYATQSAAVAQAVERMIEEEAATEAALTAMAEAIRARAETPPDAYLDEDAAFAPARAALDGRR